MLLPDTDKLVCKCPSTEGQRVRDIHKKNKEVRGLHLSDTQRQLSHFLIHAGRPRWKQ